MKSGNLSFLEPSAPRQACNGTALPFFTFYIVQLLSFLFLRDDTLTVVAEHVGEY